jgi:hypothetical protein
VKSCLSCAALVLFLAAWSAVDGDDSANNNPDPDQPYTAKKSNPVTYEVSFSAVVTPPAHTKLLKVWMRSPALPGGARRL